MKYHIAKNTIQETLVIPLYARALCTRRFPQLFSDPLSVELLERLDYDFSALEQTSGGLMQPSGRWKRPCARATWPGRCVTICATTRGPLL